MVLLRLSNLLPKSVLNRKTQEASIVSKLKSCRAAFKETKNQSSKVKIADLKRRFSAAFL